MKKTAYFDHSPFIYQTSYKHHRITCPNPEAKYINARKSLRVILNNTLSALIPPITAEVPSEYLKLGGIYLNVKKPIEK